MCIKCVVQRITSEALGMEIIDTVVGKVTPDQLHEVRQLVEARERLEKQIHVEMKHLIELGKSKDLVSAAVSSKYEKKYRDLAKLTNTVIEEICRQNGMQTEKWNDHNVNPETLEIVKRQIVPANTASQVH
ncbi:hypothetical protein [Neobacillus sp. NPDC093127]|uniref:hypothetical protein n=1 Tax=Neobacillus sp. NPDC093127 TaxID=3364296 RepID=UPI0037FF20CA